MHPAFLSDQFHDGFAILHDVLKFYIAIQRSATSHDDFMMVSSVSMTVDQSEDWMKRQAAAVGARVRRVRLAVGMSVQSVADYCTDELGYKMLRTTLANLESGARKNITVAEVSVLAKALGVPPLSLLYPIDEPQEVEVLPGVMKTSWEAWRWFADGLGPGLHNRTTHPQAHEIREALLEYGLLTENARAWKHTEDMIRSLASMDRDNEDAQESLRKELEHIAVDTHGALEFLESRGLPIPDVSEGWLKMLREMDAKIDADVEAFDERKRVTEGRADA